MRLAVPCLCFRLLFHVPTFPQSPLPSSRFFPLIISFHAWLHRGLVSFFSQFAFFAFSTDKNSMLHSLFWARSSPFSLFLLSRPSFSPSPSAKHFALSAWPCRQRPCDSTVRGSRLWLFLFSLFSHRHHRSHAAIVDSYCDGLAVRWPALVAAVCVFSPLLRLRCAAFFTVLLRLLLLLFLLALSVPSRWLEAAQSIPSQMDQKMNYIRTTTYYVIVTARFFSCLYPPGCCGLPVVI